MAKRRPAGDGMVRKREDGRWEGRIVIGHRENGEPLFRHVYAKTQKALLDKLHQNIECYRDVELTEDSRMTLGQWLDRWLTEYKAGTVRPGTLEATAATSNTTSSRSWATSRSPSSPSRTSSGCTAA